MYYSKFKKLAFVVALSVVLSCLCTVPTANAENLVFVGHSWNFDTGERGWQANGWVDMGKGFNINLAADVGPAAESFGAGSGYWLPTEKLRFGLFGQLIDQIQSLSTDEKSEYLGVKLGAVVTYPLGDWFRITAVGQLARPVENDVVAGENNSLAVGLSMKLQRPAGQ